MHIDKVSRALVSLVLSADVDGVLSGVAPAEDPDYVPDSTPQAIYAFVPTGFSGVFDEFLIDLTFWFDNPNLSNVSNIIDILVRGSGPAWNDIVENNVRIGGVQYFFIRSPSSGGRQGLKYLTLFIKLRTTFDSDPCGDL
jgi:hypothetical protein